MSDQEGKAELCNHWLLRKQTLEQFEDEHVVAVKQLDAATKIHSNPNGVYYNRYFPEVANTLRCLFAFAMHHYTIGSECFPHDEQIC
jgi:hypothetical protein